MASARLPPSPAHRCRGCVRACVRVGVCARHARPSMASARLPPMPARGYRGCRGWVGAVGGWVSAGAMRSARFVGAVGAVPLGHCQHVRESRRLTAPADRSIPRLQHPKPWWLGRLEACRLLLNSNSSRASCTTAASRHTLTLPALRRVGASSPIPNQGGGGGPAVPEGAFEWLVRRYPFVLNTAEELRCVGSLPI